MTEGYTVMSLYSGAGGLDLGFKDAGFRISWANDFDPVACATYEENVGGHIECGDISSLPLPLDLDPDVIVGGPPCQGFSVAGRMDPADPRSRHVFQFLDAVDRFRPRAFVMENVKALALAPRWSAVRSALLNRATMMGYRCALTILNAADFEVPQARERMFLMGSLDSDPVMPVPLSGARAPTVREALRALPPFGEPGNDTTCNAKVIPAAKPVMRPSPYHGSLLFNGLGRPLQLDGPAKTLPASMGGNATPIVDQDELANGARPWVVDYHAHLRAGGGPVSQAPTRLRRITVEEAAALQTFPPSFRFTGSQVAQYRQIGNAVPPKLGRHVAWAVQAMLRSADASAPVPVAA